MKNKPIKVWDVFIRIFHWLLVIAFVIEFVTEDDLMGLHSNAGYLILCLLGLRVIYGFIGSRHARFSDFIYSPMVALRYVKDVFLFRPKRYLGHNPAGGFMIVVMLLSLIATSVSGVMALAVEEHAGPMVEFMSYVPHWIASASEDLHEIFANVSLFLVAVHITGVIVESIVHGENLVLSMINGRKQAEVRNWYE